MLGNNLDHFGRFPVVGRRQDDHVRHGAHERDIVRGEVGGSVLVVGESRVAAHQFDVGMGIGHARANLLAGAQRQQGGERVDERDLAAQCQPDTDIHHGCFGHAHIEEARRMPVGEELGQRRRRYVRIQHDYRFVQVAIIGQGDAIGLALWDLAHAGYPFSSALACSYSAAEGTAPCHLAEFSMNDTPLPLVVRARITVGML